MTDYSPEFEAFWKSYPARDGQKKGKLPAFKVWVKMKAGERGAAQADVDKRNRQAGWGKYISDAERYLKNRGWEDEWTPERPAQAYSLTSPRPKQPELQLHWAERMMNRLFVVYILTDGALHDPDLALQVKREIVDTVLPEYDLDIEEKRIESDAAAAEIADLFLTRLDLAYKRVAKHRTLRAASRMRRKWKQAA